MTFWSARIRFVPLVVLLLSAWLATAHAQGTTSQTIQFLPVSDRPVTTAPFYVNVVASSQLPLTLSVQGPATIDDRRLLTLTGTGSVTITATQAGNTQYAAASAQVTFQSQAAVPAIVWQPSGTLTYGMPLPSAMLNASATAIPMFNPADDTGTVTMQLNTSQLAPGAAIPYPQTSSVFRYEGSTMIAATDPLSNGGYIPNGSAPPLGIDYRVAFTCDCQQFEYVVQSRGSGYRLWVDGSYQGLDQTIPENHFPEPNFVRVQFPDKRVRQIKLVFSGGPPFFGVITTGGDTVSAPEVPIGPRVIIFGDSWTGPTIAQAVLPPAQDGLNGSGYPQFLGETFNWDYWDSGVGGEGFVNPGTDANGHAFPQRLLTDVCPFSPAAVVIMGGTNDGGASEAADQTGINASLSNLQSCLPATPVYLYGPQFSNGSLDTAFANVVPNYTAVHYTDMGAQGWLYGPQNSTATGNEYLYFAGHPTPLGHNFLAEKIAMDLVASFPNLQPAPYSLFSPAPASGAFTYSAAAGTLLPAGNNTVTASFAPSDTANYSSASLAATITVNKAATTLALATQTQNGIPTVTLTASPQIAGTPTGTVTVSEGANQLATFTLAQAAGSYTASALSTGQHTLSFTYGGDSNFVGSTGSVTVTVTQPVAPASDFTLTASPTQLTVKGGGSGFVQLQITPSGPLNATLSLTCTGLPAQATCRFANGSSSIAVAQAPVAATVTINTAPQVSSLPPASEQSPGRPLPPGSKTPFGGTAVCGVLGFGLLAVGSRRGGRARLAALLAVVAIGVGVLGISGCGGTPVGTYTVQLQLTNSADSSMTHSSTITLLVN